MSASLNLYMNFARRMFLNNNPVFEVKERLLSIIGFLFNYKSSAKLNKYRKSLYSQQLQRLEGYITQNNPYHCVGTKMDRRF